MSRHLIDEVLLCIREMLLAGARLVFMWVPGHVGLAGNSALGSRHCCKSHRTHASHADPTLL